jgi:hypothetical protein
VGISHPIYRAAAAANPYHSQPHKETMSTTRSRRAAPRAALPTKHAIHGSKQHGFVRPAEVETDGLNPATTGEKWLMGRVFNELWRHYPGHQWNVEVDAEQGIIKIRLEVVMSATTWFVKHMDNIVNDPTFRWVMRAGGDILESLNLPRRGFILDSFLDARSRTVYGRPKPKEVRVLVDTSQPLPADARPQLITPEFASSARPR